MLDHLYIIAVYSDHVKPDPSIETAVDLEIELGGANNVKLFPGIDRFERCPEIVSRSSFYFDEYQEILILGDDIDLTKTAPEVPGQDSISFLFKNRRRPVFTFFTRQLFAIHNIP